MEKEAVEEEALARDNADWEAARSRADDACSTARRVHALVRRSSRVVSVVVSVMTRRLALNKNNDLSLGMAESRSRHKAGCILCRTDRVFFAIRVL